jgi:soluble lytic murein transglycosylase-like protein
LPSEVQALAPELEAAARRHGVDPDLLAIVVLVESGGDPSARSPMGARGLMQLMPKTAAKIAEERGLSDHDEARLDDPDYNLDLGAYFLAHQLDQWGSVELAAAAYNGGERAVERWLAGEGELSDETTRYKALVEALWQERHAARSATLDAAR